MLGNLTVAFSVVPTVLAELHRHCRFVVAGLQCKQPTDPNLGILKGKNRRWSNAADERIIMMQTERGCKANLGRAMDINIT